VREREKCIGEKSTYSDGFGELGSNLFSEVLVELTRLLVRDTLGEEKDNKHEELSGRNLHKTNKDKRVKLFFYIRPEQTTRKRILSKTNDKTNR